MIAASVLVCVCVGVLACVYVCMYKCNKNKKKIIVRMLYGWGQKTWNDSARESKKDMGKHSIEKKTKKGHCEIYAKYPQIG